MSDREDEVLERSISICPLDDPDCEQTCESLACLIRELVPKIMRERAEKAEFIRKTDLEAMIQERLSKMTRKIKENKLSLCVACVPDEGSESTSTAVVENLQTLEDRLSQLEDKLAQLVLCKDEYIKYYNPHKQTEMNEEPHSRAKERKRKTHRESCAERPQTARGERLFADLICFDDNGPPPPQSPLSPSEEEFANNDEPQEENSEIFNAQRTAPTEQLNEEKAPTNRERSFPPKQSDQRAGCTLEDEAVGLENAERRCKADSAEESPWISSDDVDKNTSMESYHIAMEKLQKQTERKAAATNVPTRLDPQICAMLAELVRQNVLVHVPFMKNSKNEQKPTKIERPQKKPKLPKLLDGWIRDYSPKKKNGKEVGGRRDMIDLEEEEFTVDYPLRDGWIKDHLEDTQQKSKQKKNVKKAEPKEKVAPKPMTAKEFWLSASKRARNGYQKEEILKDGSVYRIFHRSQNPYQGFPIGEDDQGGSTDDCIVMNNYKGDGHKSPTKTGWYRNGAEKNDGGANDQLNPEEIDPETHLRQKRRVKRRRNKQGNCICSTASSDDVVTRYIRKHDKTEKKPKILFGLAPRKSSSTGMISNNYRYREMRQNKMNLQFYKKSSTTVALNCRPTNRPYARPESFSIRYRNEDMRPTIARFV